MSRCLASNRPFTLVSVQEVKDQRLHEAAVGEGLMNRVDGLCLR